MENSFKSEFKWVASHQDDTKKWKHLTLKDKINVLVDDLAKKALIEAVASRKFIDNVFPFENLRVVINGKKVTGPLQSSFEQFWGYKVAQELFHNTRVINKEVFHSVYWVGLEQALGAFPKMYRVWLTKHIAECCGTNKQMQYWDPKVNNVCPSCGQRDEPTTHITRCRDKGRREMLRLSVEELVDWMTDCSDSDLVDIMEEYLLAQDSKLMEDCVNQGESKFHELAFAQDQLGWDSLLEGRICSLFIEQAREYLKEIGSYMTAEKWGRLFITKLLNITHKQWIFRNSHVHYKKLDGMTEAQHL